MRRSYYNAMMGAKVAQQGEGTTTFAGRWAGTYFDDNIEIDTPTSIGTSHYIELYINLSRVSGTEYFIGFSQSDLYGIRYNGSTFLYYTGSVSTLSYTAVSGFVKLKIVRTGGSVEWFINNSSIGASTCTNNSVSVRYIGRRISTGLVIPIDMDMYNIDINNQLFIADPSTGNAVDSIGGASLTESGTITQITV